MRLIKIHELLQRHADYVCYSFKCEDFGTNSTSFYFRQSTPRKFAFQVNAVLAVATLFSHLGDMLAEFLPKDFLVHFPILRESKTSSLPVRIRPYKAPSREKLTMRNQKGLMPSKSLHNFFVSTHQYISEEVSDLLINFPEPEMFHLNKKGK